MPPNVLRALRSWSGLTQRELAQRCGASTDSVRGRENGRLHPGPRFLLRLEILYRLPASALLAAYRQSTAGEDLSG